jgi:hypothetical protein
MDEIISFVAVLDGVLTLRPGPGDGTPEIAWGDTFFYYSPSGLVPERTQPFATIVTKDYGDFELWVDRPAAAVSRATAAAVQRRCPCTTSRSYCA